jgi:prepilin-type N-terminal cleavage/methylation domain-containing protein
MKYFTKISKNQKGLTLLEMLIAVSLFVVVMLISTTMFMRSIESQTRLMFNKRLDFQVTQKSRKKIN